MLVFINVKRKVCMWYYKICIYKYIIEIIFFSIIVLYLYKKNFIKFFKLLKYIVV